MAMGNGLVSSMWIVLSRESSMVGRPSAPLAIAAASTPITVSVGTDGTEYRRGKVGTGEISQCRGGLCARNEHEIFRVATGRRDSRRDFS